MSISSSHSARRRRLPDLVAAASSLRRDSRAAASLALCGRGDSLVLRELSAAERAGTLGPFLRRQYLDASGWPSRLAVRDLSVRCVYIACCFSMFSGIERLAVRWWPFGRAAES